MSVVLTESQKIDALREAIRRQSALALRFNKIGTYFPDGGEFKRELYVKHLEFFDAGCVYKERLFMAANRVGKSEAGAFESVCHATGIYPKWWTGRRFATPTEGWACGTTGETTRDIVQTKLMGRVGEEGTGMIPKHLIVKTTSRRGGIADALESIQVKHISGKVSTIGLKSYQQGRESFEGTAKHWIWLDEEPPADIYTECLYRTPTVRGVVYVTFTPLQGMSDVVKGFVEPETDQSEDYKWYIQAGWQDVPHIHEDEKKALIATTPPYQIDARTKGEPALGSGAIYPIPEIGDFDANRALFPVTGRGASRWTSAGTGRQCLWFARGSSARTRSKSTTNTMRRWGSQRATHWE